MRLRDVLVALLASVALFLASFGLPFAGLLMAALAPLPLLHCGLRLSGRAFLATLAGALALVGILPLGLGPGMIPNAVVIFYAVYVVLPVSAMVPILRRHGTPANALEGGLGVHLAALAATLIYINRVTGKELGTHFSEWSAAGVAELVASREQFGFSDDTVKELGAVGEQANVLFQYYPALLACAAVAALTASLVAASRLRSAAPFPALASFRFADLRLNEFLVFFFLVPGLALLVPVPLVRWSAINTLAVVLFLYFLQGLAILSFFLRRYGVRRFMAFAVYFLALQLPVSLLLSGVGLFDLFFDFRKARPRPEPEA